ETNHDEATMLKLQYAMEKMDLLNAWDYETRVKLILTKLSITRYDQPVTMLSGGQRKRLALARILIQTPDLLIMDEPTNHLDVEMIEWLEGYLKSADITLFLVTHDRYFLDAVCNEIIELDNSKLYTYKGNYAYYIEKKEEREFKEGREIDKARNLFRKELEWMRKQPRARGTKQKARVDAFYETKEKASQKMENKKVELDMKMQRLGGKIIELHHVNKSFPDLKVIDDFSYMFRPGERVGIIGKNGVGKSTFLNTIMELDAPDSGHISKGDTVVYGYYSQKGLEIKEDKRVLEVVKDIAEYVELGRGEQVTATQLCKRFLFDDKMQHTFVSKLSGGERRRLFLLTVLIKNPNFLVLDEPTNDLDIQTLNVLEDFLESYKGCLVIVTHDRYFMDKLVDHLFIFEGEGKIRDFNGNYQDYLDEQEEKRQEDKLAQLTPKVAKVETPEPAAKAVAAPQPTKRKLSFKEQHELDTLNKDIPTLEAQKTAINAKLALGSNNHEELMEWSKTIESINAQLDEKGMRWLELSE
ncbi:MAG: ABC-F family ATP-binding cassette domain-containing protein, partial [Bacteroidia bacterium]|nr:ABC-F family ATP-binding cassette domain-containing protein [Bacteroidia bacterium]